MALHYLTSRQAQRVGRTVNEVEKWSQTSPRFSGNIPVAYPIFVSVNAKIEPKKSGLATIMRGRFNALINSNDDAITVWNMGDNPVGSKERFQAIYTTSEGSYDGGTTEHGGWVLVVDNKTAAFGATVCNACVTDQMLSTMQIKFENVADGLAPLGTAAVLNGTHTLIADGTLTGLCARNATLDVTSLPSLRGIFLTLDAVTATRESYFLVSTHISVASPLGDFGFAAVLRSPAAVPLELDCEAKHILTREAGHGGVDYTGATITLNPTDAVPVSSPPIVYDQTPDFNSLHPTSLTLGWSDDNGTTFDVYLQKDGDVPNRVSADQAGLTYAASGLTAGATYTWFIVSKATGFDDFTSDIFLFRVLHAMYGSITVEGNATVTTISSSSSDFSNKVQVTVFDTNGAESGIDADHTNDHILITNAGVYECTSRVSVSGTAGDTISLAIFKNNGATQLGPRSTQELDADEEVISISSGPISISATDTVEVWGQNEDGTNDFTIQDGILTAFRVG